MALDLITAVKTLSQVKLVRRWPGQEKRKEKLLAVTEPGYKKADIKVIAIGASAGGPSVIHTILSRLPKNLPVPILLVQHIARGFLEGFKDWLVKSTGFPVLIAENKGKIIPGYCYIAPNGFQMGVTAAGTIELSNSDPTTILCPSVSHLFQSVADIYGRNAVGVLLTGMGKDGARELKIMKDRGAVTIAQDEASSVIYGMPGSAVNLGAARYILPPEQIAETIIKLTKPV
jgi:two-component system chemotaxis response regulator CheB